MEDNVILVELAPSDPGVKPYISRIIRSYLSKSRALEDLALLRDACVEKLYDLIEVEHIDN